MCELPVSVVIAQSGGFDGFELMHQFGGHTVGVCRGRLLWCLLNLCCEQTGEENQTECAQDATARARAEIHGCLRKTIAEKMVKGKQRQRVCLY